MSNKRLRDKLAKAKNKKEAAHILGEAIQKSGTDLAHEAKKWAESEDVQTKVSKWKKMATKKWDEVQSELAKATKQATKKAKKAAKKTCKSAKKCVKKKCGSK